MIWFFVFIICSIMRDVVGPVGEWGLEEIDGELKRCYNTYLDKICI